MGAAAWALSCVGGNFPEPVFGVSIDLTRIGVELASAYLAWVTKLYNSKDDVDGIAGFDGVAVSLGGSPYWWLATSTADWMLAVS